MKKKQNTTLLLRILFCVSISFQVFAQSPKPDKAFEKATFGAGCFWCIEPPFDKTEGVIHTEVGYAGGSAENATYKKVSSGKTSHVEVIQVTFDPRIVSYNEIVDVFWKNIDPFKVNGQFCDNGAQYRSAIFYADETQKRIAQETKHKLSTDPLYKKFGKIQTQLIQLEAFYPGEQYHQNYYRKNPKRYKFYRFSCGRDKRLRQIWGQSKPLS